MAISGAELEFVLRMRDEASRVLQMFGQQTNAAGEQIENLSTRFNRLTMAASQLTGLLAGGLAVKGIAANTLGTFAEYEDKMVMVAKTTDMSKTEMNSFADELDKTALALKGITVEQLQEVAQVAGQVGITGTQNILKFSETFAKLQAASNIRGEQGATDLARTMGLTDTSISMVGKFSDVLVELGRTMKADEQQILSVATLTAQATQKFKLGYANVLAISAAAADVGFKPELFGSVMGRTLNQIENAAVGNTKAMRRFSDATHISADEMKDMIHNDPTKALMTFLGALNQVTAAGGSTIQFLQDWNLYAEENQRVLGTMAEKADDFAEAIAKANKQAALDEKWGALNVAYEKTLDKLSTAVIDVSKSWTIFTKNLGQAMAPAAILGLNAIEQGLNGLSAAFSSLPTFMQQALADLLLIGAALIPAALGFRLLSMAINLVGASAEVALVSSFARSAASLLNLANLTKVYMVATNGLAVAFDALWAASLSMRAGLSVAVAGMGSLEMAALAVTTAIEGIGLAASNSLLALAAVVATYKALDNVKHEGYASALQKNPNLMVEMANQQRIDNSIPGMNYSQFTDGGFHLEGQGRAPTRGDPNSITDPVAFKLGQEQYNKNEDQRRAQQLAMGPGGPVPQYPKQLPVEYDTALKKLDQYRDALAEVQQQEFALQNLTKLAHDPNNSSDPNAIGTTKVSDDELARLGKLIEMKKLLANPTEQVAFNLGLEQKTVMAITLDQKNRLEIETALREITEQKGVLLDSEKERITGILKETQRLRSAAEMDKENYSLDKELAQVSARTSLKQQEVAIDAKISDMLRDHVILNGQDLGIYRAKLEQIANINALNSILDRANPAAAANRAYLDDMQRLGDALKENKISQDQYNASVANLNNQTLSARDPIGAKVRDMNQEIQLMGFQGRQQEIERQVVQETNALRDQGVILDTKAVQLVRDYVTAMQAAKEAQASGLQAWANQIGTIEQQIGQLQQTIASSVSDGLVNGIMSGDVNGSLLSLTQNVAKAFIKAGIDGIMANAIKSFSEGATDPNLSAAQQAANALGALPKTNSPGTIEAATAVVNAGTVTVNGGLSPGLPGVTPSLNPGITPANLPIGANTRTPSSFADTAATQSSLTNPASVIPNNGVVPNMRMDVDPVNLPTGLNPRTPSSFDDYKVYREQQAAAMPPVAGNMPEGLTQSQATVWNYWTDKGLQPHQVSAIMGNAENESGFRPNAVGDSGDASGLFQWNDRGPAMKAAVPDWKTNPVGQLDFQNHEFQTTEKSSWEALQAAKTPEEANKAMIQFERPRGYNGPGTEQNVSHYQDRLDSTNKFYNQSIAATPAQKAIEDQMTPLADPTKTPFTVQELTNRSTDNFADLAANPYDNKFGEPAKGIPAPATLPLAEQFKKTQALTDPTTVSLGNPASVLKDSPTDPTITSMSGVPVGMSVADQQAALSRAYPDTNTNVLNSKTEITKDDGMPTVPVQKSDFASQYATPTSNLPTPNMDTAKSDFASRYDVPISAAKQAVPNSNVVNSKAEIAGDTVTPTMPTVNVPKSDFATQYAAPVSAAKEALPNANVVNSKTSIANDNSVTAAPLTQAFADQKTMFNQSQPTPVNQSLASADVMNSKQFISTDTTASENNASNNVATSNSQFNQAFTAANPNVVNSKTDISNGALGTGPVNTQFNSATNAYDQTQANSDVVNSRAQISKEMSSSETNSNTAFAQRFDATKVAADTATQPVVANSKSSIATDTTLSEINSSTPTTMNAINNTSYAAQMKTARLPTDPAQAMPIAANQNGIITDPAAIQDVNARMMPVTPQPYNDNVAARMAGPLDRSDINNSMTSQINQSNSAYSMANPTTLNTGTIDASTATTMGAAATPTLDASSMNASIQSVNDSFAKTTATSTNLAANSNQAAQSLQTMTTSTQAAAPAADQAGTSVQQLNTKLQQTQAPVTNLGSAVDGIKQPAAAATTGLDGIGDGFAQLFKGIGQVGSSAMGGIGSIFQMVLGGLFHTGGQVGGGGTPFLSPASGWSNAPKFHTGGGKGLDQDEFRAILKTNERVLTQQDDERTMGVLKGNVRRGASAGVGNSNYVFSPTIPITVQASGNKETDATMREALMKEMDTLLDNKMTQFATDNERPGSMMKRSGSFR